MKTRRILLAATVALLVTAAIPAAVHVRSAHLRRRCRERRMQLYAPMECGVPLSKQLAQGDPIDPRDVRVYQKSDEVLRCPCGPAYVVVWKVGGPPPTCPVHGDLLRSAGERARTAPEPVAVSNVVIHGGVVEVVEETQVQESTPWAAQEAERKRIERMTLIDDRPRGVDGEPVDKSDIRESLKQEAAP